MSGKTIEVPISELKTDFYVRKRPNDERVLEFALLYEANADLPPITISWDKQVVDGRHRLAALVYMGRDKALCQSIGQKGEAEMLVAGLEANVGGSLPPTREDYVHTMTMLLERGWSQAKIVRSLSIPPEVSRKYIKDAWGAMLNAKLLSSLKAIANDGITAKQASLKFGVPLEKIQEHLNPNRKKEQRRSIAHRKQQLSRIYQGNHRKVAFEIQAVVNDFEDGKISEQDVFDFFDNVFDLIGKGTKRAEDHRNRFMALTKETAKLAEAELVS